MSGEVAIGIDWMCMLLLLSISGSSRIDQQLGKNVAMNIVAELFNKIPYTMFPYDAIQVREFNPHMPSQEIVHLRPAASRCGCVLRPNNKCVLDDSVPIQERVLVPSCPLAPNLMMEDIGIASPLYDLCNTLGITSVYSLPIDLVPWPVPYPIGVPWPVVSYGSLQEERGYLVVAPGMFLFYRLIFANIGHNTNVCAGGKTRLWVYGQNDGNPYMLLNVCEVASVHKMGPRPLFCTPCRGVRISETVVGVLAPMQLLEDNMEDVAAEHYHPGMTYEAYTKHPLRRLYDAKTDSFLCWNPAENKCVVVQHEWVERSVLPMCSVVLIKAWAPCMERLVKHMTYKGLEKKGSEDKIRASLEQDNAYIMAKIVPPRSCTDYDSLCIWVSIEVRHIVGNLKNMPYADMITIQVPPADLRPMVDASEYSTQVHGTSATKYVAKRKRDDTVEGDATMIVNRFIYASRTVVVT